jgi:ribA/ribD-fused uncharacterized protein
MNLAPTVSVYEPVGLLCQLSNYSPSGFELDGRLWRSLEHYFQASKFLSSAAREAIAAAPTPERAKDLAWTNLLSEVRSDWEAVREQMMLSGLAAKAAQVPSFRQQLWECWPWPIYEDSEEDEVWGIGAFGHGQNLMGRCLSTIRQNIVGLPDIVSSAFAGRPAHQAGSGYALVDWGQLHVDRKDRGLRSAHLATGQLVSVSIDVLIEAELAARGINVGAGLRTLGDAPFGTAVQWLCSCNPQKRTAALAAALGAARRLAFTTKYLGYRWEEDIRSVLPGWTERFFEAVGHLFEDTGAAPILVVGGGVGGEATRLWERFASRVTFADVSKPMVDVALSQAPHAVGIVADAEELKALPDERFGVYVSLRAYQSFLFDTSRALLEANRVLSTDGHMLVSISDGYLSAAGEPLRGRITSNSRLSTSDCAHNVLRILDYLPTHGFQAVTVVNLGSEVCIIARKSARVKQVESGASVHSFLWANSGKSKLT